MGGLVVFSEDITERKQAEEAARRAHDWLAFAQHAAGAGAWEWDLQTNRLTWAPELCQLFGLDPAKTQASFEVWHRVMHPEDCQKTDADLATAIRTHAKIGTEYRIVLATGELRWIRTVGEATYDANGRALRMAGLCFDITPRKALEENLRQQAEELMRFNQAMVAREMRVIELKQQVNDLCVQLGQPKPYPLAFESAPAVPATEA